MPTLDCTTMNALINICWLDFGHEKMRSIQNEDTALLQQRS